MKIRDVMTTDVVTAELDTILEQVATMMKEADTGVIPVVDEDEQLVGLVTDRDIVIRCIAEGMDATETTVEEILSEELQVVGPDTDVQEAARLMSEGQIRRLPVVEDGELVGMVSLGDIAVKTGRDRMSGDTLESVSEGVKPSRGQKKQPSGVSGRERQRASGGRQERAREQSSARGRQGIGNRSAAEETSRQERVVPIRGSSARQRTRRRAG